ncbi:unnamed protein product (macronuclear) [Paramecium tetraurelia]|uniref:BZIP domain-containing protein n=1 Tax=Paramecium tetraurelia TaxID=5888 RepID=A0CY48_PARTE|nr:uncharacterized protein GSPATT00011347001 [Paramecium tetraurelia]CAK75715.1 unnamed protein product [Paramecium tetraurelia]|eukprot:XP_001443112.1 hypothetical protein (macronuclear) [Paramecium tetraurelia strain d4-2]
MSHFDDIDFGQNSNSSNVHFEQEADSGKKKPKQNTKNTYIKKISSLIKMTNQEILDENQEKKQTVHKVQSQQFPGNNLGDKEDKLAKNRESARNSRRRKKIYLELLENKVTKLSEQLDVFKNVNERTQQLAINLQNKITQKREQDSTKMILFSNLQNSINGNAGEMNIDAIIDSLNKKFGSGSQERHQLIDHYARQIYENCLAPYINYIIGVAKTDQDIFSNQEQTDNTILRNLKLTDKQKQILQKKQQKLIRHQNELANTLSSIQEVKNQIQAELSSFDQTLEQLRRELKPSQVARFLLSIEKKDMQHHFKEQFEKCFGSEIDEDDSLELYQFMTEHNQCNSLGIDIQQTYEIYRASNDFLNGKAESEDQQQQQLQQQTKVE